MSSFSKFDYWILIIALVFFEGTVAQSAISNVYHNHYHFHSQDKLGENQPTAGLSSLNEYENGMGKSET